MKPIEEMTREELESYLAEMKTKNPGEMAREELARWNTAMCALDQMNSEG